MEMIEIRKIILSLLVLSIVLIGISTVAASDAPAVGAVACDAPAVDAPAVGAVACDVPVFGAVACDAPAVDAPAVGAVACDDSAIDDSVLSYYHGKRDPRGCDDSVVNDDALGSPRMDLSAPNTHGSHPSLELIRPQYLPASTIPPQYLAHPNIISGGLDIVVSSTFYNPLNTM